MQGENSIVLYLTIIKKYIDCMYYLCYNIYVIGKVNIMRTSTQLRDIKINTYDEDETRNDVKINVKVKRFEYKNSCDFFVNVKVGNKKTDNVKYDILLIYCDFCFDVNIRLYSDKELANAFLSKEQREEIKFITTTLIYCKNNENV